MANGLHGFGEEYRALQRRLGLPDDARERVMRAAQEAAGEAGTRRGRDAGPAPVRRSCASGATGSVRPSLRSSPRPHRRRRVFAAAAAACLVLAVCWFAAASPAPPASDAPSFSLRAYAAEDGVALPASDDLVVFGYGLPAYGGADGGAAGEFSGCLFQVVGEGVTGIEASIDRGELYRCDECELEPDEVRSLAAGAANLERLGACDARVVLCRSETSARALLFRRQGPAVAATGDAATAPYGFWIPAYTDEERATLDADALAREGSLDRLEGARLTVTATFEDGSTAAKTFVLHAGRPGADADAENFSRSVPELVAPDEEGREVLYGILERTP